MPHILAATKETGAEAAVFRRPSTLRPSRRPLAPGKGMDGTTTMKTFSEPQLTTRTGAGRRQVDGLRPRQPPCLLAACGIHPPLGRCLQVEVPLFLPRPLPPLLPLLPVTMP